ncbi:MAG: 50S ribosomal protein L18 [bacterium]|nr:50S ribosomal protein L18 [bacterium]
MLRKQQKRYRRHKRVRAKIFGTALRPRLCVFRSSKHICAQLIDDEKGITLVAASDLELIPSSQPGAKRKTKGIGEIRQKRAQKEAGIFTGKIALAFEIGKLIAKKALKKTTPTRHPIEKVVFDRGGYAFHGRVKAIAEGAREGGLKF